jgi:hypothetical protein
MSEKKATREEIQKELEQDFPEAFENETFLSDCIQVGEFLAQTTEDMIVRMGLALNSLEQELIGQIAPEIQRDALAYYKYYNGIVGLPLARDAHEKLKEQTAKAERVSRLSQIQLNNTKNKQEELSRLVEEAGITSKPAGLHSPLAKALSRMEATHHFNTQGDERRRVPIYSGIVSAEVFRGQLRNKLHWKDPTVPGNHGEYTHRIQWYLICAGLRGCIGDPAGLFQELGRHAWKDPKFGLWDPICDRNGGEAAPVPWGIGDSGGLTDFRSPETLTKYLMSDHAAGLYPYLSAFIRARMAKRKGQVYGLGDKYRDSAIKDTLARKIFSKTYAGLSGEQKVAFDTMLTKNVFTYVE